MSQIVTANHDDSVRIVRPDGTTLQIPAGLVLAADSVMRFLLREGTRGGESLSLEQVEDDDTREAGWQAWTDEVYGEMMPTPWGALLSLAGELKGARPC